MGCKGRLHRVLKLGQLPELDLVQRLPEVVKERFDRVRTWAERIEMKYLKMQTLVLESKTPSICTSNFSILRNFSHQTDVKYINLGSEFMKFVP